MSDDAIQLMIPRPSQNSGVKPLHAHLCRHTLAIKYLVNGVDVFTFQQILGRTTLEMVKRYVNLASAHVRVQHRKFSPMDKMDLKKFRLGSSDRGADRRQLRAARHSL